MPLLLISHLMGLSTTIIGCSTCMLIKTRVVLRTNKLHLLKTGAGSKVAYVTWSKVSRSRKKCNCKYPWVMLLHNNRHITLHIITAAGTGPHRDYCGMRRRRNGGDATEAAEDVVVSVCDTCSKTRSDRNRRRATTEGAPRPAARSQRLPRPSSLPAGFRGEWDRCRCIRPMDQSWRRPPLRRFLASKTKRPSSTALSHRCVCVWTV